VDDFYLLRDGASGIFLAASQFPKNRETRAPLVRELKPHANELDPKLRYLLEAPETDPEGRPTVVRYSRKEKTQYVQSEENGKATGWRAVHQNGRWVAEGRAAGADGSKSGGERGQPGGGRTRRSGRGAGSGKGVSRAKTRKSAAGGRKTGPDR
jgi:DNA topoisomerase-1